MAPSPGDREDHGWERWCGQHEARINGIEDDIKAIFNWRDNHEAEGQRKYVSIMERLASVEAKLIFFAAIAAAIGSMLPQVLAAIIQGL